jgi:hypothetical protein
MLRNQFLIVFCACPLVLALAAVPCGAVLIISEDFAYPDGNFDGSQNGGFSAGGGDEWTSAWVFNGQSDSGIDAWRILNERANAPGNETQPGNKNRQTGTVTRSFTTGQASGTTMYFGFDFERVNDAEGSYQTSVDFLGGDVWVGMQNDQLRASIGGSTVGNGSNAFNSLTFVARVEFNAVGSDEVLTVWQDPTSESDAPLMTAQADIGVLDLGTSVVLNKNSQDNNQANIDNLKLGTDFHFIPEPCTLTLASLSLLGLIGSGRRRKR